MLATGVIMNSDAPRRVVIARYSDIHIGMEQILLSVSLFQFQSFSMLRYYNFA